MGAHIIDGTTYAEELKQHLADEVALLAAEDCRPGLATVIIGGDYSAQAYERRVRRLAQALDCRYWCERLPEDVEEAEALAVIGKLNGDPRVSGILILRPLPEQISEVALYGTLDPLKDIEAVHPINEGLLAQGRPRFVPSTPIAVYYMLDQYLGERRADPQAAYRNSNIVVVGRSNNVGKPAIMLGLARDATVTSCDVHSFTAGLLYEHTRSADVLIVAAGVPELISGNDVKEGVIAIDVGINPLKDPDTGKVSLVGDLDFSSVATPAEALSPVPGGVGPITDVWLVKNTVAAARLSSRVTAAQTVLEGVNSRPSEGTLLPAIPG